MKKHKEKVTYIDDGRTIANMNVEGMPWYNPRRDEIPKASKINGNGDHLTAKETFAVMRGVLKAALLVALVFALAFTAFILFCVFVWLK